MQCEEKNVLSAGAIDAVEGEDLEHWNAEDALEEYYEDLEEELDGSYYANREFLKRTPQRGNVRQVPCCLPEMEDFIVADDAPIETTTKRSRMNRKSEFEEEEEDEEEEEEDEEEEEEEDEE
jgi:hypothetical protein